MKPEDFVLIFNPKDKIPEVKGGVIKTVVGQIVIYTLVKK